MSRVDIFQEHGDGALVKLLKKVSLEKKPKGIEIRKEKSFNSYRGINDKKLEIS